MEIFMFILSLPIIFMVLIALWTLAYAYHTIMTRIYEGIKARVVEFHGGQAPH